MKNIYYLVFIFIIFFSCNDDPVEPFEDLSEYGEGLYILTEQGVTYYDISIDTAKIIKENIFQKVNSQALSNTSSLSIINDDIYIVSEKVLYRANINTFLKELEITGFDNAQKCVNAKFNRIYVSDLGSSEIKVVDIDMRDITSHITTGTETNPTDIILHGSRAFVANSGGESVLDYDSTIVAIDIQDGIVPINEFSGNVIVDKNPISMIYDGILIILCQGIYDENNPSNNIESSISRVSSGGLNVFNGYTLPNIYNADNLVANYNNTQYYITAESGVYALNTTNYYPTLITNKSPSVLCVNVEKYPDTDTTFAYSSILYMDDSNNNIDYIYKYNMKLDQFVDSFAVNSPVIDLAVYNR